MKAIKNIFLVLGILVTVSGCDYLDSEPEKKGTLEEAFASVNRQGIFCTLVILLCPSRVIITGSRNLMEPVRNVCITSQWATTWHYSKSR